MRQHRVAIVWLGVALSASAALSRLPLAVAPLAQFQADGAVDWSRAVVLGPFLRSDGTDMPSAATTARLCRSADELLIRIECQEAQMPKLSATITARDGMVWVDDCVEIFLQAPGQATYVHLVTNPLGAKFDELGRDATWNQEWQCSAGREEASWWCELRVPFAALGGTPAAGSEWRFNLCRSRRPEPELSAWSATGAGFHLPERFGRLRFAEQPWPSAVSWSVSARREATVALAWQPDAAPAELQLTVNGQAGALPLKLDREGSLPLWLEATVGQTLLYRTCFIARLTPMNAAIRAAKTAVAPLPASPEAQALQARLTVLEARRDDASPAQAPEIAAQASRIELEASRLKLRTDFLQAGAPADAITYGVESALTKIPRETPFRGTPGGRVSLDAARNEMAAAQVVLFAYDDPLLLVEATVSAAKGPGDATLPASAFRVRRVGYVHTCQPGYAVEHTGLWPDPLMAATPFDVKAQDLEPLWLDVRVPTTAAPGLYSATLTLCARNSRPTLVPIEVRVRNFTIPRASSLSTAFGLSPTWRVPQDQEAYLSNFLEHRISPYDVTGAPVLVNPPAMDWRGAQRLRLTVSTTQPGDLRCVVVPADNAPPVTLGPTRLAAGQRQEIVFDVGALARPILSWRVGLTGAGSATLSAVLQRDRDEAVLCQDQTARLEAGEDGWITRWLSWEGSAWDHPDIPAVWDWTAFDAAFQKYLDLGITAHRAALQSPLGPWAAEYQRHLSEKGWLSLFYTYLYDEPEPAHYPVVNDLLGAVKRAAPGVANMMTARQFPPELPYVDIWCPEAYSFDPTTAKAEQAKGRSVWWYVAFSTRHPYPNVWIDYPAIDCRVWVWMTWKHDLDGMLYWSATYWGGNDPWRSGETFHDSNGDGSLLYPGVDGKPVDSIRWECLRDGLEDYEVFCLLEAGATELAQAGQQAELVAQARALCAIDDNVVRSYKDYNPDPQALLGARGAMSDTLESVVAALGHEPRINGRPRRRLSTAPPTPPAPPPVATATPPPVAPGTWTAPAPLAEDGLVLRYDFDAKLPFAGDRSGRGNDGLVKAAEFAEGSHGQGLRLHDKGYVLLPSGAELFGDRPAQGTVALWVRPDFDPEAVPAGLYEGYAVLFYAMLTDGNGLPDGLDEIGLYLHGPTLQARLGGQNCLFASVPTPLRRNRWTHLAVVWEPNRRVLYVDGQPAATRDDAYDPPALDLFGATLGAHAPRREWGFKGTFDEFRLYSRALSPAEVSALAKR
jgi:hypothetical protein